MSTPSDSQTPRIESVTPIFAVTDLAQAVTFYRDVLGFSVRWLWGQPPSRIGIARDALEIQLVAKSGFPKPGTSFVYCIMSNVDRYHEECQQRGAYICGALTSHAFGLRDFRVSDPDGNRLGFGEPIRA